MPQRTSLDVDTIEKCIHLPFWLLIVSMPFQFTQRGEGPGSDPVRFQQQGQVDWTRLSADSVNASVQVLSRISAAGIDRKLSKRTLVRIRGQTRCSRPDGH